MGHLQTFDEPYRMSALPPKAVIRSHTGMSDMGQKPTQAPRQSVSLDHLVGTDFQKLNRVTKRLHNLLVSAGLSRLLDWIAKQRETMLDGFHLPAEGRKLVCLGP